MKHSIKRQMAGIFITVLAVTFLCVSLINAFFLKDYYMSEKKKAIVSAYEVLNQGISGGLVGDEQFKTSMELICNTDNISIFVMDNSGEPKLATNRDYQILQRKLYSYIFEADTKNSTVLDKEENYTIRESRERVSQADYLEIVGTLDSGEPFIMQTAIESIRDSAAISNQFFIYVALTAMVFGSVLIWWLSRRISEPILELTDISRRMTELDFNAKFTSGSDNEIGVLGAHMNEMSENLEKTISELKTANNELQRDIEQKEDLFGGLTVEPTVFTGYETLNDTGVVVALSDEETLTDAIATDEEAKDGVLVVLDKTPFYAEMGGQVADNGLLTGPECSLRVLDVKKTPKGYYVHTCVLESGIVKVGDHLNAQVDKEYRMSVCRNHTATHLLQAALREVLGDHVHQAGSYQDAEITHFDFTHFSAVTPEELARVEKIVNDRIFDAMNVEVKEMPIEEAKKLGAMALFGEKYGKVVRVVNIEGWSTEFCGGTHVKNTAQIGCFKIVSESSVAAGIRRIEAVTGKNLLKRANDQEKLLHTVAGSLKANNVATLAARAEAVMAENKAMSKELEEVKAKIAASKVNSLFDNAEEVSGVKIASAYFTGTTGETLRGMCDSIRDKAVNPVVAVLVGKAEDKVTMAVTVNKLAQEKGLKAGVLVKEISAIAGGKGGGKPDFAMAGLKDETKIDEALAAVKGIVEKQLG